MPRQAAASAEFIANGSTRQLLQPPADLDKLEREVFVDLVMGAGSAHFVPSDVPLLACYAKAVIGERIAAGELAAKPVISGPAGDRPSPWLAIWQARIRSVTTLARMLSLSPGGRVLSRPSEPDPISGYEKFALEAARDGRN
ncbi:hypothetical protein QWJ07_32900 [Frankia sp. RB7]|nr:hypothetical protein [Frankia sp. RB7]